VRRPLNFLSIETSTDACSAAISVGSLSSKGKVYQQVEIKARIHTQVILPMIDAVLTDAKLSLSELDAIVFGQGPGSFTGLRIASSIVQGLSFASNLPVVAISSLMGSAHRGMTEKPNFKRIAVAVDARMGEIYFASYQVRNKKLECLVEDRLLKPEDVELHGEEPWLVLGNGWDVYHEALSLRFASQIGESISNCYPLAEDVLVLAEAKYEKGLTVQAMDAQPVYLRGEEAWGKC